jgi:hypothetical protein
MILDLRELSIAFELSLQPIIVIIDIDIFFTYHSDKLLNIF